MTIFRGEEKEEKVKSALGDNVRITRSRLTKIPERMVEIDTYPASLKKGTIPLTEDNAESTFKEFFQEHKDLFEVEAEDLKLVTAKKINKRWYVKYSQLYKGIPVHNATVGIDSTEDGKVGTYAANYHPGIKVSTSPEVSLDDAIDISIKTYKKKEQSKLSSKDGSLLIYPDKSEDKITYHLAWKLLIITKESNPELEKYFFIDAINGEVLRSYTARFPGAQVWGAVQGEVYLENPTDTVSTMPIRNSYVDVEDAGRTITNSNGHYHKTVSWLWQFLNLPFGEATFRLDGPYARVQDSDGSNYTAVVNCNTSSPCNLTWTATDRDHINVFYHMNLFHDWLQDELGYSWVNAWDGTNRFNARVNFGYNNAYAGNPMDYGVNDFARSSDVIYHECTHNILYYEYGDYIGWPDATSEAYAMDEGFADYFACTYTNDSRMGEGFTANPRDLNNTTTYPDKSSYNIEGHTGGTIIAGAAWDFRQRLISIYGASGARIADQLLLEAHQILSTYPRDYYFSDPNESNLLTALYRAVDTDNNLLNGFPYFNDIQHAFHSHDLLQAVLEDGDSFDFSTNMLGTYTGGDLYYYDGKFWANNFAQKGVKDLGDIGDADLSTVEITTSGYTRFGVTATSGHTYISKAHEGETGSYIVFRVNDISADQSNVTIQYFYRLTPFWYIANLNTKEIHETDCRWVSKMANSNKSTCKGLDAVANLIENSGYNGCHFCLPRYDTDTLSIQKVLQNLHEDLE
ncbi:MAG: hypothetical protein KAQ67_09085 [Gammaproteobacteria bacterium]|nr:hypothetical protein [Gammaproteobacteria bacterium]